MITVIAFSSGAPESHTILDLYKCINVELQRYSLEVPLHSEAFWVERMLSFLLVHLSLQLPLLPTSLILLAAHSSVRCGYAAKPIHV